MAGATRVESFMYFLPDGAVSLPYVNLGGSQDLSDDLATLIPLVDTTTLGKSY